MKNSGKSKPVPSAWFYLHLVIAFAATFAMASGAALAAEQYVIKKGETRWMAVEQDGSQWKASASALTFDVSREGALYRFKSSKDAYTVRLKDDKYEVEAPDGSKLLNLKRKDGKLKIFKGDWKKEKWTIKRKKSGDAYNVEETGSLLYREIGKVKYYPDKSKIKAKNSGGKEVCSMKAGALRAGPAVCLLDGLSEQERLILFTMLTLIDA